MDNSLASATPGHANERTPYLDEPPTATDTHDEQVPQMPPYALDFHPDHWP